MGRVGMGGVLDEDGFYVVRAFLLVFSVLGCLRLVFVLLVVSRRN